MNNQTPSRFNLISMLVFVSLIIIFTTNEVSAGSNISTLRNPVADFDGDGKSDISVFRPSNGYWYVMQSSGGFLFTKWGVENDLLVPGDYDGDGKTDLAVHRAGDWKNAEYDNYFYILKSSDNSLLAKKWGVATGFSYDQPTPADYDGDGKTDIASYYQSDAIGPPTYFRILQSSNNSIVTKYWGKSGARVVTADYDGDGTDDLGVYQSLSFDPSFNFSWFILQSSNNTMRIETFGTIFPDRQLPADYDGDGEADLAVWRSTNGFWYIKNSSDNSINYVQFGQTNDKPVPADYDGDGKTDIAVFRPSNGTWYIQRSSEGFLAVQFGLAEDIPIPSNSGY